MIQTNQTLKKKISDTEIIKFLIQVDLLKKNNLNAKIIEIKGKIPSISGLVTNSALITAVENKIPHVSNLVKKIDYNTKISEIVHKVSGDDHDEYATTSEFNKLTTETFKARLAQANLVRKTDFDVKLKCLNKKLIQIKRSTYLLKMS